MAVAMAKIAGSTPDIHQKRSEANAKAKEIINATQKVDRKIGDADVSQVLGIWGFHKNCSRTAKQCYIGL